MLGSSLPGLEITNGTDSHGYWALITDGRGAPQNVLWNNIDSQLAHFGCALFYAYFEPWYKYDDLNIMAKFDKIQTPPLGYESLYMISLFDPSATFNDLWHTKKNLDDLSPTEHYSQIWF